MEINALGAAQSYASARPATSPDPAGASGAFAALAQDFLTTMQAGEQGAISAMTGRADPVSMVQALAQTELAIETAVTVRNKVVEAYQEILRMPV
ncbi:flagellar hook-basal body complex protein FliE [Oceaniovalibus sp. ACAM 378]|jgi:flagellar hook-basal body complex protein FliE|uniref:flagellar hook-basal body complex protein FliE n=1 Tax=Oceaniovalibus sp. ACAM 378 TaxID=2599923 RepID=UPI0011DADE35|nr:flagellar hook-basal body complex protein FliE [Oceaniovalibus sp. ACAM 378]TYB87868.1 flagellar hook-basal body complex protein FliE [Oceaniovalibus sp. ACAM 378]